MMSFKIKFTCIINVLYKETYETKQQKKSAHANTKSLSKSSQLNCSYMTHVSVITACFSLRTAHISQPYTNKSNISLDVCVCVCKTHPLRDSCFSRLWDPSIWTVAFPWIPEIFPIKIPSRATNPTKHLRSPWDDMIDPVNLYNQLVQEMNGKS